MADAVLTPATESRLIRVFAAGLQDEARAMLLKANRDFLAYYGPKPTPDLERFNIAALKVSDGDLPKLRRAAELMHIDYRDLLMGAGFGHDVRAHLQWLAD